jgi:hypothetical protein
LNSTFWGKALIPPTQPIPKGDRFEDGISIEDGILRLCCLQTLDIIKHIGIMVFWHELGHKSIGHILGQRQFWGMLMAWGKHALHIGNGTHFGTVEVTANRRE